MAKITNGGYHAIHIWLKLHYGKAYKCENKDCKGNGKRYEWALLKGNDYDHKRENFFMLCKPCHSRYDGADKIAHKRFWKGGKPKCKNCEKELSTYKNKTGLCGLCNRQLNPPWLGKSRSKYNKEYGL